MLQKLTFTAFDEKWFTQRMQKDPWPGRISPKAFAKVKTHKLHRCISKSLFINKYLNETAFANAADQRVWTTVTV